MTVQLGAVRRRTGKVLEEYGAPLGDVLAVSAEEALLYSPTSSLKRMIDLGIAGEPSLSRRLDADSARQRVTETGLQLTIPDDGIQERALDILIERKREERLRRDTLMRAPQGVGPLTLRFAVGVVSSLRDPLNIIASFIPVVGPQRYAAMLSRQATKLGRAGLRARVGALAGAVGGAAVEPLVLLAATQEQADYDLSDSLLNVAFGTVLGAGLHTGAGAISDAIKKRIPRAETPPSGTLARQLSEVPRIVREAALRAAVAQEASGFRADVEAIVGPALLEVSVLEATLRAAPALEVRLGARIKEIDAALEGAPVERISLRAELKALAHEQEILRGAQGRLGKAAQQAETREARREVHEQFVRRKQRESAVQKRIETIQETLTGLPRVDALNAERARVESALASLKTGKAPDTSAVGVHPGPVFGRDRAALLGHGQVGRKMLDGVRETADSAAAPENVRVADFKASEDAQTRLDSADTGTDEAAARAAMGEEVDALRAEMGDGADAALAGTNARLADAEELRDVLRAAAICYMRTG